MSNFKVGLFIVLAAIVGFVLEMIDWTVDTAIKIGMTLWGWIRVSRWLWIALAIAVCFILAGRAAKGYDSDTVVYPAGARVVVDLMCVDDIQTVEYSFQALDTTQHTYRIPGLSTWPNITTLGYTDRAGSSDLITTTPHNLNQPGTVHLWGKGCDAPAPQIYSADYESYAPVVLSSDQPLQQDPYPTPSP